MSEIQDQAYTELRQENAHLKFLLIEEQVTIDELAKLCLRAADALEGKPVYDALANMKLIDELRKAAK